LNRGDGCSLNVYRFDEQTKISSSNEGIALIAVAPGEESFTQLLRDTHSGLDIRVGLRYEPVGLQPSPGMSRLRIALALEGAPDDVFDTVSRTEAATIREKAWKSFSAVKATRLGSLRFVFTLTCENGKSFMSPLNGRR
jgi:hypothetical protein